MSAGALRAGIIGAGNMGGRMGRRVVAAGDPMIAFDANPETLAGCGIDAAASAAKLVESVDVVLLSLPDSSVIERAVLGEGGVLAHARVGQVVVDLSTADPRSSVRIHDALAERGVEFLLEGLEERLRSRFEGGLVVEMQSPDHVLREKLYARYLTASGLPLDRALVDYLAARAVGSVAEIAATVQRLVQVADVVRMPLTAAFARQELEGGAARAAVLALDDGVADALFLDHEKVVWDWPDSAGRMIEEFR